ncbi:MAG: hypothetical protein LUE24_13785 [Lachnospiraceae bacterium]|nr:hypothetical protein [Lachnospiraceae bacterium]
MKEVVCAATGITVAFAGIILMCAESIPVTISGLVIMMAGFVLMWRADI